MSEEFEENHKAAFMAWLESDGEIPFDMYARDPNDFSMLNDFVPSLVIASAGGFCPFQAEGLLFGYNFYYRERHGYAELRLANSQSECYGTDALYRAEEEVEEFRDGPSWVDSLLNLIPKLERSSYFYRFECRELEWPDPNDAMTAFIPEGDEGRLTYRGAWANSASEAREMIMNFEESDYLAQGGLTVDKQKRIHELQTATLAETPIEADNRAFPEEDPVFEVRVPEVWRQDDGRIVTPWAPAK